MAKGSYARKKSISSLSVSREQSKMITSVSAINPGQKSALKAIANSENCIIFIDGVAGTGKTFISASWGLEQVLKDKYQRMIITRPYVEAGESLGFLPGSFDDKIAPFMIPIMDVFNEHLTSDNVQNLIKEKQIITLPLAYMRGVTFKKAFVLLDEAQNCTIKQMHLFLTRIGEGSKLVVAGDTRQSDLGKNNGFSDALERLKDMKDSGYGVEIVKLDSSSVVRHGIISEIEKRYTEKS